MTASLWNGFATQDFVPHATCLLGRRDLIQLFAISDSVIAFSYYSIPFALAYFAHRRVDLAYRWMIFLFAAFILACGTNHLLDVWTLWYPSYPIQGVVKAMTAALSLATAILLWRLIPGALALPSPAQLARMNRQLTLEAEQRLEVMSKLETAAAQRERVQQELRTNEVRLRAILDTAIEGIIMFDATGKIETANPAAAQMFGYDNAELLGGQLGQLMADCPVEHHHGAASSNPSATPHDALGLIRETVGIRRDGRRFPLEMAVGRFTIEERTYYVGILRDVTRRKQSEAALRASEKRLELALLGSDVGTWDWNINTGEVVFSDRWATMLGYAPHEIRPHYEEWEKLVHPDDLPQVLTLMYQHLQGLAPLYEAEYRLATRAGDWLWVLARGKVLERDAVGSPLRATGTHMDISARKQLELRLAEQNEELARVQRLTTAGEVAAMMAHELNQPLAAIANYLGGAKLRFGPLLRATPQLEQVIDATLRLSDRAADVVSSIRDLVRQHEFRHAWVCIDPLVEDALQLIYSEIHQRRIHLIVDVPPNLPPVWGQGVLLKQLLLNLVLNAIDAMRDSLRGRCVLTIAARTDGFENIRIEVSDTGAGIAPEIEASMFKPFVSTKADGMGLGLAICRTIVDAHSGCISADSTPGKGTTFHVVLPMGREEVRCAG